MEVSSPFGSQTRTRVLVALRLLEQSYSRELSRFLRIPLSVVQKGIRSLERDNLITGRFFGKTRIIQLNPSYFAAAEVRALLNKLVESHTDLRSRASRVRRRPRRTGKRL
jgi:predicted transcriptional regulator